MINKKQAVQILESLEHIRKNIGQSIAHENMDDVRSAFPRLSTKLREMEELIGIQVESERG